MKKILVLTATMLLSLLSFAGEYINDEHCIYLLNVGAQTASVINFCSNASLVIIPESFVYREDKYIVTSIGYNDLQARVDEDWLGNSSLVSYGKYSYETYDDYRASVKELILPKTLKEISYHAFEGMTRLKSITIPASIKKIDPSCFKGNVRIETIVFEGIPHFGYYDKKSYETIYLDETDNPLAVLDSIKKELKEGDRWHGSGGQCPRLREIEVLPLKDYLLYQGKIDKLYMQFEDSVSIYKQKLKSHPYYAEDNYFKSIKIQKPKLSMARPKEDYAIKSKELKKECNRQLVLCKEIYQDSYNDMELICKKKYPDVYAEKYCTLHPDFSAKIDSMLRDYKCKYTKNRLAKYVLLNFGLGEKCQDELWSEYGYLFKSKELLDFYYDRYTNFEEVIASRRKVYNEFKNVVKFTYNTKGYYDIIKDYGYRSAEIVKSFRKDYDNLKRNGIPVSKEIIAQDPKALKEFDKNGKYFDNADDFFAAYITKDYSKILKQKKKAKK